MIRRILIVSYGRRKSYSSVFESSVTEATKRSCMDDVIKKLTAEQALEVVKRLSEKGGEIGEAVLAEARNLLTAVTWKTRQMKFSAFSIR